MKNSKEYSKEVNKLFRSLKRKNSRPKKPEYEEPLEALVFAIVGENITNKSAKSVIKQFNDYFIDLNDLRVSSTEEIIENLGSDTPLARGIASSLTDVLKAVFNRYHTVSLKILHKMGKRQAKQVLEQIGPLSSFTISYCMLTSLGAHAIPLTEKMIEYLKKNELVHPDSDNQQIEGFLTRQIAAKNAYEFYHLLRKASESSKTKKKTKRKTKKRKTKKRKTRK
ncbi:hypothetical protein ACFL1G_02985 [Planctomycetota bacterium]